MLDFSSGLPSRGSAAPLAIQALEVGDNIVGQPWLVRGHLQPFVPHRLKQQALLHIPRHDGRPSLSAAANAIARVDRQLPLRLRPEMALITIRHQHRANLLLEVLEVGCGGRRFRRGCRRCFAGRERPASCEYDRGSQKKRASVTNANLHGTCSLVPRLHLGTHCRRGSHLATIESTADLNRVGATGVKVRWATCTTIGIDCRSQRPF